MRNPNPIRFFVDESLPIRSILRILAAHDVQQVTIAAKDPEILRTAEEQTAIVVVQDKWFLRELYRLPRNHRDCMKNAGVIKLPGEWDKAGRRLERYLPVIEVLHELCRVRADDHRLGIDLSQAEIRIFDPWN